MCGVFLSEYSSQEEPPQEPDPPFHPWPPRDAGMRWTPLAFCVMICLAAISMAPAANPAHTDTAQTWAFHSPTRPTVPVVSNPRRVRNPIDAFILARQTEAGLHGAPAADRRTLIRRVTFDLTGLPPTPSAIQSFLADRSPNAYERLVDRLLASPEYGEHWATFWLDLVRYAETDGFKADDRRPDAWRYRDYVIRSFNADKPYDRFVQEQLAGDELFPDDPDARIATGYNRHYPDEYNAVNLEQRRQEILNDMTDTTGLVFLGLTVGCARCHDHKFDPISQKDYYRLQAFFAAFEPVEAPLATPAEEAREEQQERRWEDQTAILRFQMHKLEAPYREELLRQRKARFPKEYQAMYELPAKRRTPLQEQIAEMVARQVEAKPGEMLAKMSPEVRKQWQALQKQLARYRKLKPAVPEAMALADVGPVAPATYILKRGDWQRHGKRVQPGFPAILDEHPPRIPAPSSKRTTGRRSALARWLTRPDNPLTARVIVNRLWQQHFGRGIVANSSDFGVQGGGPSHPKLLDLLACELMSNGWRLKPIQRLIVTSATYRQASTWNEHDGRLDPDNRLLWRMNRRRLEGEALRDAMLSASGQLNPRMGGPAVYPRLPSELKVSRSAWPVSADPRERARRSVYIFAKRNLRYPLLRTFDAPDGNESCPRRSVSTTAPQALLLLNNQVVLGRAGAFAHRVLHEVGTDRDQIIDRAYLLALGRLPQPDEHLFVHRFFEREGDEQAAVEDLCHALFNLNEFLYVD